MMKLMSDLIAYLRDLLVFKVKPDAVANEFNPELQHALQTQAELVETDRLLELIDQFAGAEGRMKWAPNKKLHFEVAVIKAIQTLEQVTLNEVIENLSALRDGTAQPAPRARRTPVEPPKPISVTRPTAPKQEAPPPKPQPKPVAAEPAAAAPAQPEPAPALDAETLWTKAVDQIRARRPLIKGWIESAKALGTEGRFFLLGFPPEQKTAMESIAMPRNRDFLQSVLKEISGQDWDLKFSLKEGLAVEAPNAEPLPPKNGSAAQKAPDPAASFKDDPLIREALEIFKGEIKPVTE
jgi:DNA polymerase-3 subunit gamma/tau